MKKIASILQILVFVLFIGALGALHFLLPDRSFSGRESLQTAPRFTASGLFSGRLMKQLEDYVNDQFPFRDAWVELKAGAELASGKQENNGVFLCAGETLIEPFTAPEKTSLERKLAAVDALAEQASEIPVYFALIPSAAEIWSSLLPEGAPNDSQSELIDACYGALRYARCADLRVSLGRHAGESIYYRTDHHWTALGARYGYEDLIRALGQSPVPQGSYSPTVVSEEFYGTLWSSSGFSWVRPDRITTYVSQGDAVITTYPAGQPEPGTLYAPASLSTIDQYSYFYGGNTPLLTVETGSKGPKLLILRDSYMDSLSPYLFPHYSELHILDLRYYKSSLRDYIAQNDFDQILVCYSVKNFCEDTNLYLLAN